MLSFLWFLGIIENRNEKKEKGVGMEGRPVIQISVRNLVEFILRSGDIDNRIGTSARAEAMQEGSKMHRKIQRRMGVSYQAEVPLKTEIKTPHKTAGFPPYPDCSTSSAPQSAQAPPAVHTYKHNTSPAPYAQKPARPNVPGSGTRT